MLGGRRPPSTLLMEATRFLGGRLEPSMSWSRRGRALRFGGISTGRLLSTRGMLNQVRQPAIESLNTSFNRCRIDTLKLFLESALDRGRDVGRLDDPLVRGLQFFFIVPDHPAAFTPFFEKFHAG